MATTEGDESGVVGFAEVLRLGAGADFVVDWGGALILRNR